MNNKLILASASPRRKKILTEMGIHIDVVIPMVEEIRLEDDPEGTVKENALLKHRWARERYPDRRILTADTIVVFDGKIIEKPESMEQAVSFLHMFSGKTQKVLTAVALSAPGKKPSIRIVESIVHFKKLSASVIKDYFTKVNPMDKAGAYDVDQYGYIVIESYDGSHSNIMGLPAEAVQEMLQDRK